MKKNIFALALFSPLFLLPLLLSSSAGFADTITIRADVWCPFNCEPTKGNRGFMIDIAQKVFSKSGHVIEYKNLNWARAIEETRTGKYNAIVGAFKSDAPDFIYPANELGIAKNAFFVKQGESWRYSGIESLQKITIAAINGYTYEPVIDEYIAKNSENFKLVQLTSGDDALEKNVKKLLSGRVHTVLEERSVMQYFLKQNSAQSSLVEVGSVKSEAVYIAFSPKAPQAKEWADLLGKGLDELRKSGELMKILAEYGLKDWK